MGGQIPLYKGGNWGTQVFPSPSPPYKPSEITEGLAAVTLWSSGQWTTRWSGRTACWGDSGYLEGHWRPGGAKRGGEDEETKRTAVVQR